MFEAGPLSIIDMDGRDTATEIARPTVQSLVSRNNGQNKGDPQMTRFTSKTYAGVVTSAAYLAVLACVTGVFVQTLAPLVA